MYNIYTFNKEQLARQNESKQKAKEAVLKEKHIRQRDKMVANHRNRIKKFVLDLVKKPIFIEDVDMPDNKFYNSNDKRYRNQSASPQKFIFNRFLTDKERIKQLELNKKEELQKMSKYKTLSEERKGRKYEQPTMRFKHRTQLERIVDQLNHYNYNEQHNFILKKQINRLHKNTVKIPKTLVIDPAIPSKLLVALFIISKNLVNISTPTFTKSLFIIPIVNSCQAFFSFSILALSDSIVFSNYLLLAPALELAAETSSCVLP